MAWRDKVSLDELFEFCTEEKERKDIKKKFNLTTIESWHCVKYLSKFQHKIMLYKNIYIDSRKYFYKTRKFVFTSSKK